MRNSKFQEHTSLSKTNTERRMFLKIQNYDYFLRLAILRSENVFFKRIENVEKNRGYFKKIYENRFF